MEIVNVPGTKIELRIGEPLEEIEMVAHSGECKYCKGIVKMFRDRITGELQPDNCACLLCGQRYFVKINGSIKDWEVEQWKQKSIKEFDKGLTLDIIRKSIRYDIDPKLE